MHRFFTRGLIIASVGVAAVIPSVADVGVPIGKGGWEYRGPNSHLSNIGGNSPNNCCFISKDVGWMISGASIVKTTDGGKTWVFPASQPNVSQADSLFFLNDKIGWAGVTCDNGASGTLLQTRDGGATWTFAPTPACKRIFCIFFVDESNGYIVANRSVHKTNDSGRTWTTISSSLFSIARIECSLFFIDANTGWFADNSKLLKTTDGGITWTAAPLGEPYLELRSVFFLDHNTGWASGQSRTEQYGTAHPRIFKTTDGGDTWVQQNLPSSASGSIDFVRFLDANFGWAWGSVSYAGTYNYDLVWKTTNGGDTWTPAFSYTAPNESAVVSQVWFADHYNATIIGTSSNELTDEAKSLFKTSDGGETWEAQQTPVFTQRTGTVYFLDHNKGWASAFDTVYRTLDSGANWSSTKLHLPSLGWMTSMQFLDADFGVVMAHFPDWRSPWAFTRITVAKTSDGGATWAYKDIPLTLAGFGASQLHFVDRNTAWLVCNNEWGKGALLAKTTDGGETWTQILDNSHSIRGLECFGANTVWVSSGSSGILKSTDGGANWVTQNTGVSDDMTAICFIDANTGWAAGGNTIIRTTDGGATWTQCNAPAEGDYSFASMSFASAQAGWIATPNYICVTTDGGRTWHLSHKLGGNSSVACAVDADTCWVAGEARLLCTTTRSSPGCSWAKEQPDQTPVHFGDLYVTAKGNGYVYAEHFTRQSGIRISVPNTGLNIGDLIYVHGKVGTSGAERVINADSVDVLSSAYKELAPLGMPGITNGGLSSIGLLVKVWGQVKERDFNGKYVEIDSGRGRIRVDTSALTKVPNETDRIVVTGISSVSSGKTAVTPRSDEDIVSY